MIFQHTWQLILDGKKTQTRRVPGKTVYEVGKTYAIQPGRRQKAVGRLRMMEVRQERLGDISPDDVRAEGFASLHDFQIAWQKMRGWDDQATVMVYVFELVLPGGSGVTGGSDPTELADETVGKANPISDRANF